MGRKMGIEGGEIGAGQGFDRKKMPKGRREGVGREGEWEVEWGVGMGWVGEMGREDWKMGMISDCYQLQENQRKNDPLTVKTPSPLHWFPSCLVDAGRQDRQRA